MKPGASVKTKPAKPLSSAAWDELEAILVEGIREWLQQQGEKADDGR